MKLLRNALLAVTLSLAVSGLAQINVLVNGEPVHFTGVGPQKIEGRILVPLRGVMEKLGAYVGYQGATKTVTATRGDVDLQLVLGQRRAVLNGRDVMMDVPAMEYRGSTLVPLRFMSEALGAEVKWDGATSTVMIATNGTTDSGGGNPPTGEGISISAFNVEGDSLLKAGSVISFTLKGTPGGTATVQIPGLVKDIALKESGVGVYTGAFTVPEANKNPITVSKASAIARLKVGNNERLIQAGDNFQVDNQAPTISATTPELEGRVNQLRPNITAVFEDQNGSGIDSSTVRLRLDGKDVTEDATVTANLVAYKPAMELTAGKHEAEVRVKDRAGNYTAKTWTFNVVDKASVITSFKHDAPKEIQPGDEITFTLLGEPGATVNLSIGDLKTLKMEEVSQGKYTASYVVRRTDRLDGVIAKAKLKTKQGEAYTADVQIGSVVASDQPLSAPKITSPIDGEKVDRNIVFKGKADANAKIQIRIEFTQKVFGAIPISGVVADLEVEANDKGQWETREIDLDTGLGKGNITYTVTAITLGADNKMSEATKITLKR
ncbi:MAG: hypothetical protein BGO01_03135 [Armatimonadetes bacterium 55-13]|nr:copper amine oxidase N-terminal domain-containing protein [Armatimonadota bacterium]OJU63654.1 MAG: hypothetical protein BGO01_03135 [Armatimonadetes bacterium 55-13]